MFVARRIAACVGKDPIYHPETPWDHGREIKILMETRVGNGRGVDLQKLIDDLKDDIRDGEELLKSGAGQLRERAAAGTRAADETVRKNPYTSMGVVFGVGLLMGILAYAMLAKDDNE